MRHRLGSVKLPHSLELDYPWYHGQTTIVNRLRTSVYFDSCMNKWKPGASVINGRVDRASVIETALAGSIPSRVKPKTTKNWYSPLPYLTFSNKRDSVHCAASTECGRQGGRWQLDSKTEPSLRCFLAKATW